MSILARSTRPDIEQAWSDHANPPAFEWLRRPHVGLVMVRGKAGGTGNQFNLGEMTVTRCALRLADGTIGHGYVQGRDRCHAQLAALLDALLQHDDRRQALMAQVIEPLQAKHAKHRQERSRKAAATKVEFFTMVRGENAS